MGMPLPIWDFSWEEISMQTQENGQNTPSVVINYVDLDNNMAKIASSGQIDANSDYQFDDQIKKIEDQGYELVNNGFTNQNFDNQTHLVTFKHQREVVNADNLGYGINMDDVVKNGQQIVHYQGAGNRTPRDSKTTVKLTRSIVFDKVTKREIGSKAWQSSHANYQVIGSPSVQGYTPSEAVIGGTAIDPENPDVEYTVDYHLNKQVSTDDQAAVIRFLDIDNGNQPAIKPVTVIGKPNSLIDYDPTETINQLTNKGYELVDNEYNPDGAPQFFDANENFDQTYVITLQHRYVQASAEQPQEAVDEGQYKRSIQLTVQFAGAGDNTPQPVTQTAELTRTITVDLVTGQVTKASDWQTDKQSYAPVDVPVVDGFHTTLKQVAAQQVMDKDISVQVDYHPNGGMVPVDEQGQLIDHDKVIYHTDPHDPTKAAVNQTVPQIDGYQADETTISPEDVAADTKVQYSAIAIHKPLAVINYIDMSDESNQLASSGLLQGEAGQKISAIYSTADEIERLKKKGYQVLYNNFDRRKDDPVFSDDKLQTFTVALVKTDVAKDLPSALTSPHDGEIVDTPHDGDDLSIIFDALKSLNSLLGLMMKNNLK